jgi:hypothetical protein
MGREFNTVSIDSIIDAIRSINLEYRMVWEGDPWALDDVLVAIA